MRTVLDLATVLLFYPLLGGTRRTDGLPQVLADYREGGAVKTTVGLLRARPSFPPAEQPIADFLLGTNFAELGLDSLAARNLAALVDSPTLGGGAFVALARVRDEAGEDEALAADAQRAPWGRLDEESLGEAAVRVARACMRLGRYAEAREWLCNVPAASSSFAFSRVLLVQTEYALGRPAAAIEVAQRAFDRFPRSGAIRWLDDRTAVLVGDMLTEIGLYHDAIDVLAWPASTSPFHRRAERDRNLARVLEAAGMDSGVTADRSSDDVEREIAVASGSESALAERAAELRAAWPSPVIRSERRRWAAGVAADAFERTRPFEWRRLLEVAWRSLPPVALYELAKRRRTEADPKDRRTVGDETRFFFAPRPDVSRLLVGLALISETPPGRTCADRAATAVATRVAASYAPGGSPVTSEELASVAGGCEQTEATPVREALERALRDAIAAESSRHILEVRERRLRVAEAIAAAEVERAGAFHGAGGAAR